MFTFQASFEGCIEKWFYTNDLITTYGMMPYWYLTPGGSDPYSALPLSSRTNYYVPPYSFTWTNTAGGLWSMTGNWANGSIANGSGLGADFSALDLTANTTVHLDSARTIGSLILATPTSPRPAVGFWTTTAKRRILSPSRAARPRLQLMRWERARLPPSTPQWLPRTV